MRRHSKLVRQKLIIGSVLLFGIVLPAIIFFASENGSMPFRVQGSANTVEVSFTKLTAGRQSVVARRVNYFITSAAQLSEIWEIVNASGAPPNVDFKKQAVIAVFAGNESSSSIAIAKIEDSTARMVSIALTRPDCASPPSTASPYEIVAVPSTALPLEHTDISTTISCRK